MPTTDDTRCYDVVHNEEGQYSLWPAGRGVPAGWSNAGVSGPKSDCLAYISSVWIDMRPRSLRRLMDG